MKRILPMAALSMLVGLAGCGGLEPTVPQEVGKEPPPATSSDILRLQGAWVIDKVEMPEGKKGLPDNVLKGAEGTIKGRLLTMTLPGASGGQPRSEYIVLTFDNSKSPKEVDLHESNAAGETEIPAPKGATARAGYTRSKMLAIYKYEGESLIVAAASESGAPRPTEFKPKPAANPAGRTLLERSVVIVVHLKRK